MVRSRRWVFTLNNYSQEELEDIDGLYERERGVRYLIFGREQGDSGTPHLQGYVEFEALHSLLRVKALIGERAHFEVAKGTGRQASTYCKKDGDFYEFGELKRQGRRSDLEAVKEQIVNGADEATIADQFFGSWCRYRKSFKRFRELQQTGKRDPPEVIGLSGPSGCGKTRYVFSLCERKGLGLWSWSGGVWFDGYRGQDCALFDDLDAKAVSDFGRGFMLRVLDRYPMSVPVKGDFVKWVPKVIFITSNFSAGELVNYQDEFMRPLLRRISIWVEFDETTSEWKECEGVGGFSGGRHRIYEDVSTFLAELE